MENTFKKRLAAGEQLIGIWSSLASDNAAEACALCGMDWMLLDCEHAPNDSHTILTLLRAISAHPTEAVVRPPTQAPVFIKKLLDVGVKTLLLPMVDTAEQAREIVRATRHPPHGNRGVSTSTRAGAFGTRVNYLQQANEQICVLVQAETRLALENLDDILAVPGVDGVFIGPADLSADMGHLGNQEHPEVKAAIRQAIQKIQKAGKHAGFLTSNPATAQECLSWGAQYVAVGTDIGVLVSGVRGLAERFHHFIAEKQASA